MSVSYYFWKWADNDLPGRPREVHATLLHGQLHPALQTFDARPLVKKLERAAAEGRKRGEEWEWEIASRGEPKRARFVFVTCPELDFPDDWRWRMCKRFFALDVSGCDAESGRLIDFFLPKLNAFESGQHPDANVFDIGDDDLPVLIRSIRATGRDPFAILTNRRNHFVQFVKVGHRYRVEWRENYSFSDFDRFDQWAAEYPAGSTIPREYVPAGCVDIRQIEDKSRTRETDAGHEELLRYADTLRIFQAFLRGGPRPAQYRWVNINHIVA